MGKNVKFRHYTPVFDALEIYLFCKLCLFLGDPFAQKEATSLASAEVLVILQTSGNWKEPLPYNTCVILLSQSTSLTFKRMQKKTANVLLKFSNLKPPSLEIKGTNQ